MDFDAVRLSDTACRNGIQWDFSVEIVSKVQRQRGMEKVKKFFLIMNSSESIWPIT